MLISGKSFKIKITNYQQWQKKNQSKKKLFVMILDIEPISFVRNVYRLTELKSNEYELFI